MLSSKKNLFIKVTKKKKLLPRRHLFSQSQKQKHQNMVPIMPKADNTVTSMMPIASFWCPYCTTGNVCHTLLQCFHCQP